MIDKAHSIFWSGTGFQLFILKLKEKDSFIISTVETEKKPKTVGSATFMTGDEFSSLVCEIIKYCLDLPEVARSIPCPVTILDVPHGCLQEMKSKIHKKGDEYYINVDFDERLLKYHGYPQTWQWIQRNETWGLSPDSSKAIHERTVTQFRILGINEKTRIQTEENPAINVLITMKKCLLDQMDKAVGSVYLNRQDLILSAIRNELKHIKIEEKKKP